MLVFSSAVWSKQTAFETLSDTGKASTLISHCLRFAKGPFCFDGVCVCIFMQLNVHICVQRGNALDLSLTTNQSDGW